MILGIDFDGTLCEQAYPEIGTPYMAMIFKLVALRKKGVKLILWTCRDGEKLTEAVEWCKAWGLEFDAVNDDLQEIKDTFTFKSKKIFADYYIDDRNKSILDFLKEA